MSYMISEAGNGAWSTALILPSYHEEGPLEIAFRYIPEADEFYIEEIWMELDSGGEPKMVNVARFPSPCMEAIDILNTRKEDIIQYEQIRT